MPGTQAHALGTPPHPSQSSGVAWLTGTVHPCHARAAHTPAWPSRAGNRSPQVHQEVRSLAQGENQTWKHDVEKHAFAFRVPSSLYFSISQNILCGLTGPVAACLPAAGPDVLRPPNAHVPTGMAEPRRQ